MDEEASWVGLGWSLNPGSINRSLRGLPDDFNGEKVETKVYQKPNWNVNLNMPSVDKLFGFDLLKHKYNFNLGVQLSYNNYNGFSLDFPTGYEEQKDTVPKDPDKELSSAIDKAVLKTFGRYLSDFSPEMGTILNYAASNDKERNILRSLGQNLSAHQNLSHQSFAYKPVVPYSNLEFENYDFDIDFTFGPATKGFFKSKQIGGGFSIQKLRKTTYNKPAFGNYYHWNKDRTDALLDFNKERDGVYHKGTPYLAFPISSYDLLSVSGQGISGQIRPFRNAIDIYSQDDNRSVAGSGSAGFEFGQTTDSHVDMKFSATVKQTSSGKWNTDFSNFIESNTLANNTADFEHTTLRMVGEKIMPNNQLVFNQYSKSILFPTTSTEYSEPVSPNYLSKKDFNQQSGFASSIQLQSQGANSNIKSPERTKRNLLISALTNSERAGFLLPDIYSVNLNSAVNYDGTNNLEYNIDLGNIQSNSPTPILDEVNTKRKPHHIGEYTITKNDGSKYVYGLAAYNNEQTEVNFTIADHIPNNTSGKKGILRFGGTNPAAEIEGLTQGYGSGRSDKSFRSTKLPAYSHSHFLTAVLSPDYFDVVPKGPGPEDLGNYTRFDYARVAKDYVWRTPYRTDEVAHSAGLLSVKYDDKASYTKGTKELWYLQKISGKNRIAIFFIEPRKDGLDASGENKSYMLRKISLYDRVQFESTDEPLKTLAPIRSVWFNYDYSLCKGIENSENYTTTLNNGKLTLKEIFYTYGFSTKKFSVYKFKYKESALAVYNPALVDRWGNFKTEADNGIGVSNFDFPYATSNRESANQFAGIWSLEEVKLPSGGTIKIKYEADDYAYVQDKRAGEMFKIEGFGPTNQFQNSNALYVPNSTFTSYSVNRYLYVKIPNRPELAGLTNIAIADQMLDVGAIIYFKTKAILKDNDKEWIKAYATVKSYGVAAMPQGTDGAYIYIEIKEPKLESLLMAETTHPIAKAGFQLIKDNFPERINPSFSSIVADDNNLNFKEILFKVLGVSNYYSMLVGTNFILRNREYFRTVDLNNSWVRLANPEKARIGGGHRVKSVEMADNWLEMSEDPKSRNQSLIQEYEYTTTETIKAENITIQRTISSGVAAYEPQMGSEENPMRLPIRVSKYDRILPDEERFDDGPLGESFFPSPVVGYSKVTIKSIGALKDGSNQATATAKGTSKTVQEFFTAKDFPVKVVASELETTEMDFPILSLFYFTKKVKKIALSQGYRIELNDMHGKQKATYSYAMKKLNNEYVEVLHSYVKNYYKTQENKPFELDNQATVLFPNGTKQTKEIGVENDFYVLNHKREESIDNGRLDLNLTLLTAPPAWFPVIVPSYERNLDNVFITTSTQVINRYGLLEATEANTEGSIIRTENLAYDAYTGEVLVTKTFNEFKEPVYSTVKPAHWVYNEMGQGSKNVGIELLNCSTDGNGKISGSGLSYLTNNDHILITNGSDAPRIGYISKVNNDLIINYKIENDEETFYGGFVAYANKSNFKLKILSSGFDNRQSFPVEEITSLINPIGSTGIDVTANSKILNVKTTPYGQLASNYKAYENSLSVSDSIFPVADCFKALNYLAKNMNLVIPNALSINNYTIPESILNSTNDFTTSSIFKFQKYNNGKDFKISLESSSPPDVYGPGNIKVIFNLQYNTLVVFEIKISNLNIWNNSINKKLWNIEVKLKNSGASNIYVLDVNQANNSYFEVKDLISGQITTYINDLSNGHLVFPGINSWSLYQFVKADHLSFSQPKLDFNIQHLKALGQYSYKNKRTFENNVLLAKSGYFTNFEKFNFENISSNSAKGYLFSEKPTLSEVYASQEIESKDELNRYRALGLSSKIVPVRRTNGPIQDEYPIYLLQNYDLTFSHLPTFYVDNSRHCQSTCFNFESKNELVYNLPSYSNDLHYFKTEVPSLDTLSKHHSHTGKSSLAVNKEVSLLAVLSPGYNSDPELVNSILPFYPEPGDYQVSCWVKPMNNLASTKASISAASFDVNRNLIGNLISSTYTEEDYGEWKRIVFKLTIPSGSTPAKYLRVFLNGGSNGAYFDDFRIHPLSAAMKSYVYDEQQRVIAELDENNYASYYIYNNRGELISIRKETSKGVQTVTEGRKGVKYE